MAELSRKDTLLTLTGVTLALFLGALDQTIVSTALPHIVADLQGVTRYAWIATIYLVTSTVMVPIYGKLADTRSRRAVQLVSVLIFLVGSILCGLAGLLGPLPLLGDGMTQLIIFRGIQGIGGAGMFALAFIIIADLFPPADRGRYMGVISLTWALASVLGPLMGGFLSDYAGGWLPGIAGWRWVFFINLPLGGIALWFLLRHMPPLIPPDAGRRMNLLGASLLIIGMVPLVAVLQLNRHAYPWSSPLSLSLLLAAFIGLGLFLLHASRSTSPVIDLQLFRERVFRISAVALFFYGSTFICLILFLPLYLVNVVGVTATRAGITLIPLSVGVSIGAFFAGQMVSRIGHHKHFMIWAGCLILISLAILGWSLDARSLAEITVIGTLCGLGLGPTMPLYPLAVQNAVPRAVIGQATSACQFFRQIGGAVGTALMGSVLVLSLMGTSTTQGQIEDFVETEVSIQGGVTQMRADIEHTWNTMQDSILKKWDTPEREEIFTHPDLPSSLRIQLEAISQKANGNIEASEYAIRELFDNQMQDAADQAVATLQAGFTTGTMAIFRWVFVFSLIAWIATLFLPEQPLRKTH